jgi:hypothetical protein
VPKIVTHEGMSFVAQMITRSPGSSPRDLKVPATLVASSNNSEKLMRVQSSLRYARVGTTRQGLSSVRHRASTSNHVSAS